MGVKLDLIDGARVVERNGVVEELDRVVRVNDITTYDSGTILDFFAEGGVPVAGDQHPDLAALILEDRNIRRVASASYAELVLTYRRHRTTADYILQGAVSAQQKTRYKDSGGTLITVTHDGDTIGASISADEAMTAVATTIVEATNTPGTVAQQWGNTVNSSSWAGGAAGTWRCTNVAFAPAILTISPTKWHMTYSFVYNAEGWQPTVAYIDSSTGRPPNNLVDGVGIKDITHYTTLDFNTKFA